MLYAQRYDSPAEHARTPLVILHGLFGSSLNWRSVARRLERTVFCLDLRNHGRSKWQDEMNYELMAEDVARFIDAHNLHEAAVLGHSMGGKTAMTLAQAGRVAFAKLIVVDIAPIPYNHSHEALLAAMEAVDFAAVSQRQQVDAQLARGIPDPRIRQFLAQNLAKDGERYRWQLNLAGISRNMDALMGYDNPRTSAMEALFIAGGQSEYIGGTGVGAGVSSSSPAPSPIHGAIFARFPNARIETIEQAGHWLHAEQPAELIALCNAFLGD